MDGRAVARHGRRRAEGHCAVIDDHVVRTVDVIHQALHARAEVPPGRSAKGAELGMSEVDALLSPGVLFRLGPFHLRLVLGVHAGGDLQRVAGDLPVSGMAQVVGMQVQRHGQTEQLVDLGQAADDLSRR